MILGIDASNIRAGGGVTHLVELLGAANPIEQGFKKVVIWGGTITLDKIESKDWLEKIYEPLLEKSLLHRTYWQRFRLSKLAKDKNCDLLFIPGGSFAGSFRPFVTMSQNLLPFEWKEIKRYGLSIFSLKMLLLNITQSRSFEKANGTIFLTDFARSVVLKKVKLDVNKTAIVHHGIHPKFYHQPEEQKKISEYSENNPIEILYISFIGEYKHQWNVVRAVGMLRQKKIPVRLTLVGSPDEKKAVAKLNQSIQEIDLEKRFIKFYTNVPYSKIKKKYREADIFIFASSCETFGQILTEAMASGLPIACSKLSAMPELLGEAGVYFDPEDPKSIAKAIKKYIESKELRKNNASLAFQKAKEFTWNKASKDTFNFIKKITEKEI